MAKMLAGMGGLCHENYSYVMLTAGYLIGLFRIVFRGAVFCYVGSFFKHGRKKFDRRKVFLTDLIPFLIDLHYVKHFI